ncbi:MAG: amidohydrolase [Chloroflexi bacterium]|nr:amidohydrolase [Chloroflexota bacterium]
MSQDYFIVDCHVHLYRTERQGWMGRAINNRFDKGGTLEQLLRYMDEGGVAQSWVINAWPTKGLIQAGEARIPKELKGSALEEARQQVSDDVKARLERANEWLCSTAALAPGRVAPFIGLDPYWGADWMVREIEDKHRKGAKGVKLIPTWGEFYPNDRAMWPAYARMVELGMVILSHCGGSSTLFKVAFTDCALPKFWDEPLREFPKLNVVLAHTGYYRSLGYGTVEHREKLELTKKYPNVYFDLSQNNEFGYGQFQENMVRALGVEKVVWASDWHAHRALMGLEGLKKANLSEAEKRLVLGENARRLVKA